MDNLSAVVYQLTKTDKVIFLLFLITFPMLMLFTSDEPFSLKDFGGIIWLTINSALLVYLIVFFLLKKHGLSKGYLFLLAWISCFILFGIALDYLLYYLIFTAEVSFNDISCRTFFEFFLIHVIQGGILLGIIMFKKNIESQVLLLKADSLQKSNELRLLKAQIDPHFLFNNLNTLDALMDTNVEKAKAYIHHLAQLYQYLLANKDEETVSLEEELKFAKGYCYLIKERFGDSYQFHFKNEYKGSIQRLIPPGAIQTLFENIVKHNNASIHHPIIIEVLIMKDTIEVKNNIRSKNSPTDSFGIGLNNLETRYQLLSNQKIKIEINSHFMVRLPLIEQLKS